MVAVRFLLLQARPESVPREQELASMRSASGLEARLDALQVDRDPLPSALFDRYAGVITGGSPYNVTDPESSKSDRQRLAERQLAAVAEQALAASGAVFFTCFGIGVLTRVLGGVVDRTHPERVSATESRLTDAGAADPVAGVLPTRFLAHTGHKESAPVPPPGTTLLATNDASPVQLYRVGNLLASQFHPEPTPEEFVARATAYARYGYFAEDELERIAAGIRRFPVSAPRALLARFVATVTR